MVIAGLTAIIEEEQNRSPHFITRVQILLPILGKASLKNYIDNRSEFCLLLELFYFFYQNFKIFLTIKIVSEDYWVFFLMINILFVIN